MKKYCASLLFIVIVQFAYSQNKVFPVIKNFGGIYDIPEATVKPTLEKYNIVIDVVTRLGSPKVIAGSLNNVARLINLHAVGGVKPENINVVLAIHGQMTYSVADNKVYRDKFGVDNPNVELIKALKKAGVKITVCGQSLIGREIKPEQLLDEVEVATSMLTTVTTYQLRGYAMLKF